MKKKYPTYKEITNPASIRNDQETLFKKETVFGYWMQTLADVQFLNLELSGLSSEYQIDTLNYIVHFGKNENIEYIRNRIAHLDKIANQKTFYAQITDVFNDTNAYAFHSLYPYKGKFYPRLVRTLVNAFKLNSTHTILDPFNGCGTTVHECGLMGIKSIGIDINPIGNFIAHLKNELPSFRDDFFYQCEKNIDEIFHDIKNKRVDIKDRKFYLPLLFIYFDTIDAFERTNKYRKKGELNFFKEKFYYIKDCYLKLKVFLNKRRYSLPKRYYKKRKRNRSKKYRNKR